MPYQRTTSTVCSTAGDFSSAYKALEPSKFETPWYQDVYIWLMVFALNFSAAAVVVNCVLSILIDVYGYAPASHECCTLCTGYRQNM